MADPLFISANDFSANLFSNLSSVGDTNVILSPISILSTLYLLLYGSAGSSKLNIAKTLRIKSEGKEKEIDKAYERFTTFQKGFKQREPSFQFNDNIFVHNDNIKLSQTFTGKTKVTKVDFGKSEDTAQIINDWVSQSTGGLIQSVIDAGSINPDTILQVLNTVYFKGAWEKEFDENKIHDGEFTNLNGLKSDVEMLTSTDNKLHAYFKAKDTKAQIVELPYLNSNLSMLVVLPDPAIDINNFISVLPKIQGQLLKQETSESKVEFMMPKFKFDNDLSLNDVLSQMGMSELFVNADLSKMLIYNAQTQPIQISDITHAAVIEVDEKGTKAAAATKISVVSYSFIQTPQFICNRPFMFYIIDRNTRLPLFTGVVKNLPDRYATR